VLRLLDARTGTRAEVRLARPGVLRACAQAPRVVAGSDITAQRLVLVADLLARAAELSGLQVLTALDVTGASPAQAAAIASDADALGIHPPAARVSCLDAPSSLGGPVDVHLIGQNAAMGRGEAGLVVSVGAAQLEGADSRPGAAAGGLLTGHQYDPLAARLALMSFPNERPAVLTGGGLSRAGETLADWRQQVARWAESPSRSVPTAVAEAAGAAFSDLDTVSALAMLRDLATDASVPVGAKFEAFVYADRILGLDLARDIGR
jgi:hypothetical protein